MDAERVVVCTICLLIFLILLRRRRIIRFLVARQALQSVDETLSFLRRRSRRLRARNNLRPFRRAWVYPWPQAWFEEMFHNQNLAQLWKKERKATFEYICQLVYQDMSREDTRLRKAVPVYKRVAIAVLRFGQGKSTVIKICEEFTHALSLSSFQQTRMICSKPYTK